MPGLNTSQLKAMRTRLKTSFLTDRCDIYKHVFIPDGAGSATNTWNLVSSSVPCRFEELAFRAGQIDAYAGSEYLSIIYKVYFEYDRQIDADFRLFHNNNWYESRVLDIDMTDNLYKKMHVVKILNVRN